LFLFFKYRKEVGNLLPSVLTPGFFLFKVKFC
jgi:hypothetical protein